MKYWLITINNFLHDLFTGFWVSTLIVIYIVKKHLPLVHRIPAETFRDVTKVFFWLGIFSLLIIIVTGIFRTLSYSLMDSMGMKDVKKHALIVKHILLGLIFAAGSYLSYIHAFK
jgi:putative copper export protein